MFIIVTIFYFDYKNKIVIQYSLHLYLDKLQLTISLHKIIDLVDININKFIILFV